MKINLHSGSGSGKSVTAAKLYAELSIHFKDLKIELVTEYVKGWAYLKRRPKSNDQIKIFGEQQHSEDILFQGGVDIIVTDSPLLMGCAYAKLYGCHYWQELTALAKKISIHPSIDIFLNRKGIKFSRKGRYENKSKAIKNDLFIKNFLKENGVKLIEINTLDFLSLKEIIIKGIKNWQEL